MKRRLASFKRSGRCKGCTQRFRPSHVFAFRNLVAYVDKLTWILTQFSHTPGHVSELLLIPCWPFGKIGRDAYSVIDEMHFAGLFTLRQTESLGTFFVLKGNGPIDPLFEGFGFVKQLRCFSLYAL